MTGRPFGKGSFGTGPYATTNGGVSGSAYGMGYYGRGFYSRVPPEVGGQVHVAGAGTMRLSAQITFAALHTIPAATVVGLSGEIMWDQIPRPPCMPWQTIGSAACGSAGANPFASMFGR